MIILVTGSRFATLEAHRRVIRHTLAWMARDFSQSHELWDGSCDGVDVIARDVANEFGWKTRPFAANWDECGEDCAANHKKIRTDGKTYYCPTAGFRRNALMVNTLTIAEARKCCVAFPIPERGSRGTEHCLSLAWKAGIPTFVMPLAANRDLL